MAVLSTQNLNNTYHFVTTRKTFEFFHRSETISDVFSNKKHKIFTPIPNLERLLCKLKLMSVERHLQVT